MKKIYCVSILLCIFTGYLFSQSKENGDNTVDTVIKVDTIIVEEPVTDTVVVKKSKSEQEEKYLSKYNFYNDYMNYIKETKSTDDTLVIKKEKIGIILAEGGVIGSRHAAGLNIALSIKIPISDHIHITPKISRAPVLSLMIGQYLQLDENEKFLIEVSIGVAVWLGLFFSNNASVYYRVSKNALLSFGIDFYVGEPLLYGVSLGVGITY